MYYYYYYIVTGFPFYRWNRNYNNNRKGRDFRMKNKSNIFILFKFGAIVFFTIRTQIFNLFLGKSFTYQIYNMQFKTDVFTNRKKKYQQTFRSLLQNTYFKKMQMKNCFCVSELFNS